MDEIQYVYYVMLSMYHYDIHQPFEKKTALWLLIAWWNFGARKSATIMMT